ncbi:MAG: hypothetical protein RIB47_15685 [Cyclobacteriaceae bacterium]
MKTLSFALLLVGISVNAQSQDSLEFKNYYEQNAILWTGWTKYYKNNQAYPLKDLRKEIVFSTEAQNELALYRRNRTFLDISMIAAAGLLVSSLIVEKQELRIGLATASIVTATISLPFSFSTSRHLSKAIWFHNRDVLLKVNQ